MLNIPIGSRLRAMRKQRGLSLEQLSEQVGIATESLGHIECGTRLTSLQTLVKLADILDVSLDFLTGRSSQKFITALLLDSDGNTLTDEQWKNLLEIIEVLLPYIKR